MAKVTQDLRSRFQDINPRNIKYFMQLCVVAIVLYTPEILNSNIEQEYQKMTQNRNAQEPQFLGYPL
jgi:hypothetical protein